jgi:hypothetical protein
LTNIGKILLLYDVDPKAIVIRNIGQGKYRRLSLNIDQYKGSLGRPFSASKGTGFTRQNGFYPYVLRDVSVVSEPLFGHFRYRFGNVPPQPNSLQINVDCLNESMVILVQKALKVLVSRSFTSQSK